MTERRCIAAGKQVLLDGKHLADAVTPEAAQVIADCVEHIYDDLVDRFPEADQRIKEFLA